MGPGHPSPDELLLDRWQRAAFGYFVQAANPANGLVADTSRTGSPVSIAVVGFALAAYPSAVERGWMTRADAVARCLAVLRFLRDSDQSGSADATGYQGFYYHFLDLRTGARAWRSELSMIDTALLIAGALVASTYFSADTPDESEVREIALGLYRRIDWRWAQGGAATIRQGWKRESGFLHYGWDGYSEAILLYVLALGSPTHAIECDAYHAWTATYQWENLYGYDLLCAAPLFVHQFSHAFIDFRGLQDRFMRDRGSDYFENSRRATYVQREYARRNPGEFSGYGEHCFGLSAGDGPSDERKDVTGERRRLFGYAARGVPYGPDDGTLSCPAVLASLPFAPEIVLPAVRHMTGRYPEMQKDEKLASGFNPTLAGPDGRAWVSPGHYGLDQGIVQLMIENHRTELVWRLMRSCPPIARGLGNAGFRGGWLQAP
jgi:hypothetical protein